MFVQECLLKKVTLAQALRRCFVRKRSGRFKQGLRCHCHKACTSILSQHRLFSRNVSFVKSANLPAFVSQFITFN